MWDRHDTRLMSAILSSNAVVLEPLKTVHEINDVVAKRRPNILTKPPTKFVEDAGYEQES